MKIPGFRVKIAAVAHGQEVPLHEQDVLRPPGTDLIDYSYGSGEWNRIRVRRKTFDGDMYVTFRDELGTRQVQTQNFHVRPGKPADMMTRNGATYRVSVERLPESRWIQGGSIAFRPPKATIVGQSNGWSITFEPNQVPCVLTVAVDSTGTKDENLPSFPFPSSPRYSKGTYFLQRGTFGAQAHGTIIRLGIRGAGMECKTRLPAPGETIAIEPTSFGKVAAAQPEFLQEAYVLQKFQEKQPLGLIGYSLMRATPAFSRQIATVRASLRAQPTPSSQGAMANANTNADGMESFRRFSRVRVRRKESKNHQEVQELLAHIAPTRGTIRLLTPEAINVRISELEAKGALVRVIGTSRQDEPLRALSVGSGPKKLVAIAGAHSDEPTGAATCLYLCDRLLSDPRLRGWLDRFQLHVVPMANPDGSKKNSPWVSAWTGEKPDLKKYFEHVERELFQEDVEFGFPRAPSGSAQRPENVAIARWFDELGTIDHYVSLHSMFLGGGALFLVMHGPTGCFESPSSNAGDCRLHFLLETAAQTGMPLHDKDRCGEKGFQRIAPGLQTAPTGEAIGGSYWNSMEYVTKLCGASLALVTEIRFVTTRS